MPAGCTLSGMRPCDGRKFAYDKSKATVSTLLSILKTNGLIRSYMEQPLQLIGTIRNKEGGHGKGAARVQGAAVPESIAGVCMNLTASAIVYLAKADEEMP